MSGNSLVVTADAGGDTPITLADAARVLRTSPGQADLKTATPISAADVHIGDRVLARGQAGENGTLVASLVVVMAKSDIAQRQQQEREEWRKGVGGLVKSVDAGAGTVTLANSLLASGKPIVVHVAQTAQILRYAPDSVKFEDAKNYGFFICFKDWGSGCEIRGTARWEDSEFVNDYTEDVKGKPAKMRDTFTSITPNSHTLIAAIETADGKMKTLITTRSTRR